MTTQAPTLPASWSQPSGCFPTRDIWYWEWNHWSSSRPGGHDGGANLVEMLGGPADLSCYPPSYTPSGHMLGTACPDGFTAACDKSGLTTCCPTAYDFTCHHGLISTYAEVSCSSNFSNTTVIITPATITATLDGQPVETGSAGRYTLTSGSDVLFAMGVAFANLAQSTTPLPSSTAGATYSAPASSNPATTTSTTSRDSGSTVSGGHTAELTTSLASARRRGISIVAMLVTSLAVVFTNG